MNRILFGSFRKQNQSVIGIPLNSGIKPQFLEWKSKFHTFACNLTLLTEKGTSFATAHTFSRFMIKPEKILHSFIFQR